MQNTGPDLDAAWTRVYKLNGVSVFSRFNEKAKLFGSRNKDDASEFEVMNLHRDRCLALQRVSNHAYLSRKHYIPSDRGRYDTL